VLRRPCAAVLAFGLLAGTAVAQSSDPKTRFVQTLGQFSLALDATYGDEGPRILAALDALERAAAQWDDAIHEYETEAAKSQPADLKRAASMHVGLGGLYLDRARYADAIREFDAAVALDSTRADAFTLKALASAAAHDMRGAAMSFRKALDVDPASTARAYSLARAAEAGGADDAKAALRTVVENQKKESADGARSASSPFMRFGIVEERTGVEPFFPPARYAEGFVRLVRGDFRSAFAQLKAAASRDAVVTGSANQSYSVRQAAAAFRGGDIATAVVQLQAAIELFPEVAEPHRLLGDVYAADEQYEQAIRSFNRAIALDPDDERARLALADTFVRTEQQSTAELTLRDAIAAIPGSGRAHYALARLFQREGRQVEAAEELQRAAAFNPLLGLNGIYQALGAMNAAVQRFDAAIDMYSRRVDIQPNDAGAHQDLGDTYARLARDDDALAEFSVALLLEPTRVATLAAIAQVRLRNGEYEAAAAYARRAVDLDPAHAQARYTLATALLRLGNAAEGQKELETFQRLQEATAAARAHDIELGGLRREASISSAAGDHQKAVMLLRQALAIAPKEAVSHLNLGIALMLAGQPAEAAERFASALALNGPDEIHERLAQAYVALGRTDDSRREMELFERLKRARLQREAADR
jgi:tetratricopeptide (TPR) repeat protein